MINKQSYQIQGMRQDNLVSTGFSSKFAHEIKNMRFNTIGDYTTASWTTEKGTDPITVIAWPINGELNYSWFDYENYSIKDFKPIGQAVIDNNWVLFGIVDTYSVILCLRYNIDTNDNNKEKLYGRILYWGDLGFNEEYPIETLAFYENDLVQKVYWTDGLNQPRVINIKGAEGVVKGFSNDTTQFDFVPEVSLEENVTIKKIKGNTGLFPPCTVKYAITYYRKYGQESNIVYDSPLYYPTKGNRACAEDELSGDAFEITVDKIDKEHNFDYIRLYSIIRTSDNATPIVRIVEDKYIKDLSGTKVTFIDTNTTGRIIDPNILFYLGGNDIVVSTLDQKDNVLFLGNIEIKKKSAAAIWETIDSDSLQEGEFICDTDRLLEVSSYEDSINNYYRYKNQLNSDYKSNININPGAHSSTPYNHLGNSQEIKIFKNGEWYRFGIQFQDTKGKWSDIIRVQDIECDKSPVLYENNADFYEIPYFSYNLPSTVSSEFINKGYKKARLVCCYTTNSDRSFIAQGIICPTIKRAVKGEEDNRYASWFFRENLDPLITLISAGADLSRKECFEIQGFLDSNATPYEISTDVFTLNSPEFELDKSLDTIVYNTSYKVNTIGYIDYMYDYHDLSQSCNIDTRQSIYIDATGMEASYNGVIGLGLIDPKYNFTIYGIGQHRKPHFHNFEFAAWDDNNVYYTSNGSVGNHLKYPIYPFQRDCLNNYVVDIDEWPIGDTHTTIEHSVQKTSKINMKVFSTLIYAKNIISTNNAYFNNILNLKIINDDTTSLTQINNTNYYSNVNTIVNLSDNPILSNNLFDGQNNRDITRKIYGQYKLAQYIDFYTYRDVNGHKKRSIMFQFADRESRVVTSDPIELTYKSTPHAVFAANINSDYDYQPYIVELTRKVSEEQRFGGINNRNCIYIPCGPAEMLSADSDTELKGYEGDHYFMRYDCLKTYPYSTEDVNQIVEIMSYMTETRINLDGRYDNNRGLVDNTTVLPTNFNLVNKSYTQSNNFFSYTELRDDEIATKVDKFPNQFTWTDAKLSGEDIDKWTILNLASVADAEGTLGKINKITNVNGNLLLFQDYGIAKINFNENTALQTTSGVPLELAKTGKYQGLNYISKDCGCQNKWSISSTKNGLFWIDDSRQELMSYSNESPNSVSTLAGMESFMINNLPKIFETWNPKTFNNFVTYYDKLSNDIYYINKDYCLAWNEEVKSFTSFYDYNKVPYMVNLGNHSLMWKVGLNDYGYYCSVWAARESDKYNNFFGNNKDYWITVVCDGMTSEGNAFPADKVFNNIEYRADIYNMGITNPNTETYNKSIFNVKQVWNGYQNSKECDIDAVRKFNTWRVQLPRNSESRDRIRSPFCYIKLKWDTQKRVTNNERVILHDLAVYFDIR